jgi:probable HAF family extracellular repeat protein
MPAFQRLGAIAIAAVCSFGIAAPHAAHAAGYVAHPLMTGSGQYMVPAALGDNGMAVGRTAGATPLAVLARQGQPPITWSVDGNAYNQATAISSNGLIAGDSGAGKFDLFDPFLRQSDGTVVSIFASTPYQGMALGVNAKGVVVGMAGSGSVDQHAFAWHAGTTTFIPTIGGTANVAFGVNDAGTVVGWSETPDGIAHARAFRWSAGVLTDLGTLPGGAFDSSAAQAINASGYTVGYCQGFAILHACAWDAAGVHDLGTLPGSDSSVANAVNDLGVAVGDSADPTNIYNERAVIFHDGIVEDLNSLVTLPPGVVLTSAVAIDKHGVILALASKGRFNVRAYWLAPR